MNNHVHYVEVAASCGHLINRCPCSHQPGVWVEAELRERPGWCAKCATRIAFETTRQRFPAAFTKAPTIKVQGNVRLVKQEDFFADDGA